MSSINKLNKTLKLGTTDIFNTNINVSTPASIPSLLLNNNCLNINTGAYLLLDSNPLINDNYAGYISCDLQFISKGSSFILFQNIIKDFEVQFYVNSDGTSFKWVINNTSDSTSYFTEDILLSDIDLNSYYKLTIYINCLFINNQSYIKFNNKTYTLSNSADLTEYSTALTHTHSTIGEFNNSVSNFPTINLWNLKIFNYAEGLINYYPMAEGDGIYCYDVVGNKHARIFTSSLTNIWSNKQHAFAFNTINGYYKVTEEYNNFFYGQCDAGNLTTKQMLVYKSDFSITGNDTELTNGISGWTYNSTDNSLDSNNLKQNINPNINSKGAGYVNTLSDNSQFKIKLVCSINSCSINDDTDVLPSSIIVNINGSSSEEISISDSYVLGNKLNIVVNTIPSKLSDASSSFIEIKLNKEYSPSDTVSIEFNLFELVIYKIGEEGSIYEYPRIENGHNLSESVIDFSGGYDNLAEIHFYAIQENVGGSLYVPGSFKYSNLDPNLGTTTGEGWTLGNVIGKYASSTSVTINNWVAPIFADNSSGVIYIKNYDIPEDDLQAKELGITSALALRTRQSIGGYGASHNLYYNIDTNIFNKFINFKINNKVVIPWRVHYTGFVKRLLFIDGVGPRFSFGISNYGSKGYEAMPTNANIEDNYWIPIDFKNTPSKSFVSAKANGYFSIDAYSSTANAVFDETTGPSIAFANINIRLEPIENLYYKEHGKKGESNYILYNNVILDETTEKRINNKVKFS